MVLENAHQNNTPIPRPAGEEFVIANQFSDTPPTELGVNLDSEIANVDVDEGRFSLRSVARYLNPVEAAKGYGRFVKRTFRNFALSEVNGTITALAAAYATNKYNADLWGGWGPATAGAMGENIGFHGTNATRKYRELRRLPELPYNRREALSETGRYMLASFALAEAVDTPVRSVSMWVVPEIVSENSVNLDPTIALLGGKILADNIYYGIVDPSVTAYQKRAERRKIRRAAKQAVSDSPYAKKL